MITVQEYLSKDQKRPFHQWFFTLPSAAAVKVSTALVRMESGNTSNIKWLEGLGEYRINWGKRARTLIADYKAEKKQRHERGA